MYLFNRVSIVMIAAILLLNISCAPDFSHEGGTLMQVHYAQGFEVLDYYKYKKVIVRDPIKTEKIIATYYLVNKKDSVPAELKDETVIRIPINSIACMSTTHLGFLERLNLRGNITGISGCNYVYDSLLNSSINDGEIKEIGNNGVLNYEFLAEMRPDIFMTYVFGADGAASLAKLKSLQVQPVINNEYLELTPLGQAEWIKFVALFFDKWNEAKKIFNKIEADYQVSNSKTLELKSKPKVLTGLPFRGEWTVPGGQSFAANYLRDAGGDYLWSDNHSSFNFPVSMEQVLVRGQGADVWINIGAVENRNEIADADPKLTEFNAYKSGNLYNNNNRMSATGGNDYWESGVVNPDLILSDLVHIFHPELNDGYQLVYYKKID